MEKIIEFKNLNFEYDEDAFFENFNMAINEQDIVSLIGPTSSGKTTLLKMLCHKLPNTECYYYGKNLSEIPIDTLRKKIIVIFDAPMHEIEAKQEILYYIKKLNITDEEIEKKYEKITATFDINKIGNTPISKLSYREICLIKILRYLIIEPTFLAIDCLFSYLTTTDKEALINYVKHNKITLLNVVNDLNDTLYGNKIYVLEDFELIMSGNTSSVLKADTLLKRMGFSLPLAVYLSIELINYDVLKKVYLDTDKLVGALWK